MNFLVLAAQLDQEERVVEAAWAYERAIATGQAELAAFLDLAVLYFYATDFGMLSHHHLSDGFAQAAWERSFQVLDEAEQRFGPNTEIAFWRRYFPYVRLGEPPFVEECEAIASTGSSLVPYFHLYAASGGDVHREQAAELYKAVKPARTSRQRWIKNVLDSPALPPPMLGGDQT